MVTSMHSTGESQVAYLSTSVAYIDWHFSISFSKTSSIAQLLRRHTIGLDSLGRPHHRTCAVHLHGLAALSLRLLDFLPSLLQVPITSERLRDNDRFPACNSVSGLRPQSLSKISSPGWVPNGAQFYFALSREFHRATILVLMANAQ